MAIFSSMVQTGKLSPILGSWKTRAISFARLRTLIFDGVPSQQNIPLHLQLDFLPRCPVVDFQLHFTDDNRVPFFYLEIKPLRHGFSLTVPASNVFMNTFKLIIMFAILFSSISLTSIHEHEGVLRLRSRLRGPVRLNREGTGAIF